MNEIQRLQKELDRLMSIRGNAESVVSLRHATAKQIDRLLSMQGVRRGTSLQAHKKP